MKHFFHVVISNCNQNNLRLTIVISNSLSALFRFDMRWSRVEFERKEVVACENVGILSVTLTRSGDLSHSAFIGIHVREISAKIGEDFIPNSAKQVQFDPGNTMPCQSMHSLDVNSNC